MPGMPGVLSRLSGFETCIPEQRSGLTRGRSYGQGIAAFVLRMFVMAFYPVETNVLPFGGLYVTPPEVGFFLSLNPFATHPASQPLLTESTTYFESE